MTDSMRWFSLVMIIIFMGIVYLLGPVIMPFIVAFLLAYFLDPLTIRLNKLKIPRIVSGLLILVIVILVILAILFALIPALEKQITAFAHQVPQIVKWLNTSVIPWVNQRFHTDFSLGFDNIQDAIVKHFQANNGQFAKEVFSTIFNSGYVVVEVIMNIIMIPVITLYLLVDWARVTKHGKNLLPLPADKREITANLIKECGDILAGFLRGQLLVMIGSGVVYSIGLSILGLDLALLIGVIAGTLTIVPYLGFITGLLIAVIAALIQFHSFLYVLGVLVVFAVGVLCENFVFSPLFVGDRIGLHPVAVIFAVLAGGKLFGFVGVLLALPVAAIVMILFRHMHRYYFGPIAENEVKTS